LKRVLISLWRDGGYKARVVTPAVLRALLSANDFESQRQAGKHIIVAMHCFANDAVLYGSFGALSD